MKGKGGMGLCAALAALLVLGAIALGAYRGWNRERQAAAAAFSADATLGAYLEERAMDAANLRVVASRHLDAGDPRLTALTQARAALTDPNASVEALAQADAALTQCARELQQALPQLQSVQDSSRDQAYVTTLTRTLLSAQDVAQSYNQQAEDFNARLNASLTGRLAQLLGVTPLSAYDAP